MATLQIRTIAANAGRPWKEVRDLLRKSGVRAADGSPRMYSHTQVDVAAALTALNVTDTAAEPATPPSTSPDFARLEADAAAANTLDPVPSATGTGNEDDPLPQDIIEGTFPEGVSAFPMPTSPDPNLVYWPVNINPNRQTQMMLRGWRFVTNDEHIRRIRPDGLYRRMRTTSGRVRYMDLELAFLPREIWSRRKAQRAAETTERVEASTTTLAANVEATQRELRGRMGAGGDRHLDYVEFDDSEATERAEFDRSRKRGESPTKSRVFTKS